MKKFIMTAAILSSAALFGASKVEWIVEELQRNSKISELDNVRWEDALINASIFIKETDPKRESEFLKLHDASNRVINTIKIINNAYLIPARKEAQARNDIQNIFYGINGPQLIEQIGKILAPLYKLQADLKKKPFLGNFSLFKKKQGAIDVQKVLDVIRQIILQEMDHVLTDFKEIKDNRSKK
jgi:hypothetical protein